MLGQTGTRQLNFFCKHGFILQHLVIIRLHPYINELTMSKQHLQQNTPYTPNIRLVTMVFTRNDHFRRKEAWGTTEVT